MANKIRSREYMTFDQAISHARSAVAANNKTRGHESETGRMAAHHRSDESTQAKAPVLNGSMLYSRVVDLNPAEPPISREVVDKKQRRKASRKAREMVSADTGSSETDDSHSEAEAALPSLPLRKGTKVDGPTIIQQEHASEKERAECSDLTMAKKTIAHLWEVVSQLLAAALPESPTKNGLVEAHTSAISATMNFILGSAKSHCACSGPPVGAKSVGAGTMSHSS